MMIRSILALCCLLKCAVVAQSVHHVPFASQGNVLEVSVRNGSSATTGRLAVRVTEAPSWLTFLPSACTLQNIPSGAPAVAEFTFSVLPSAAIGQNAKVRLTVVDATGAEWQKEVGLIVDPPNDFRLLEAFPNPFNPATTVSFDLPERAHIELRAYDLIGRMVTVLTEGELAPGRHQRTWNASGLATGVYLLVLEATQEGGATVRMERRVVLAK